MKILVMKFRNIGDVLLISPLLSNLKYHYPNSTIDVALNQGTQEMITLNPKVDNILIYDRENIKKQPFFKRVLSEINFARDIKNSNYDMVINLTKGDRGALLALFSGARIKIGYKTKNFFLKNTFTHFLANQGVRHTIETNLDPLRALNLEVINKKVEIFNKEIDEQNYKDFIHIHPVSRWLFKCIDDKLMAMIIDYCKQELHHEVILTASPDRYELQKIDSILSHCKTTPLNLAGQLSLKQTSALNKKAKCFIGVDTAIMHISAANDIPTLAFFGPSGAFHWGPWDNSFKESTYTQKNGIQSMGKHIVIQENWECIPCGADGCNKTKISDCLMKFDTQLIKNYIKKILNDKNS